MNARYFRERVLLAWLLVPCFPSFGVDYFVATGGSDLNSGLSPAVAFASIDRVNSLDLNPGDRVLFEGGSTFSGSIQLSDSDRGAVGAPVSIGSYGQGRSIIDSGALNGVEANSAGNIEIRDLVFKGNGAYNNTASGVRWHANDWGDSTSARQNLVFDNLDVSGYNQGGIIVEAVSSLGLAGDPVGWKNVQITNNVVYENGSHGIGTWGPKPWTNSNFYVGGNRVFDNHGLRNHWTHTGSGILVGGVTNGLIEYNVTSNNGKYNGETGFPQNGPVGLWAYESSGLVIQYNESFGNKTQTGDGGGFDFDGGITNSVMQYNYSHDNDGAGYLVAQYENASSEWRNVVFRNNVSENDSKGHEHGSLAVWSWGPSEEYGDRSVRDLYIYNNTIFSDASVTAGPLVSIGSPYQDDLEIFNNAFILRNGSDDETPIVWHDGNVLARNGDSIFSNNAWEYEIEEGSYEGSNTLVDADWGWESNSVDGWVRVDGSVPEELDGLIGELGYGNIGEGIEIDDPQALEDLLLFYLYLAGYELDSASPLKDAGVDPSSVVDPGDMRAIEAVIETAFRLRPEDGVEGERGGMLGASLGAEDFLGGVRVVGDGIDIGAVEVQFNVVPEPSSIVLLLVSVGGFLLVRRR